MLAGGRKKKKNETKTYSCHLGRVVSVKESEKKIQDVQLGTKTEVLYNEKIKFHEKKT